MRLLKIESITPANTATVYDISVDDVQHYILENGIYSHNSGLLYSGTTIIFLSKAKDKDGDGEQQGNFIRCRLFKSRFVREGTVVRTRIRFDGGLDRYFGLLELAIECGVFKKVDKKVFTPNHMEKGVFENRIHKAPEEFYTEDVLKKIDEYTQKNFTFSAEDVADDETEETDEETEE